MEGNRMTRSRWAAAAATILVVTLGQASSSSAADQAAQAPDEQRRAGIQLVPKQPGAAKPAGSNPLLSLVPDPSAIDHAGWRAYGRAQAKERNKAIAAARQRLGIAAVDPILVDEQEPDAIRGGNDWPSNAQLIPQFGSAAGKRPAARILGTLAAPAAPSTLAPVPEDNGSIPLAGETGLTSGEAVVTTGTIGDGPHGRAGDGTGDFDFYAVRDAIAGRRIIVDTDTPDSNLDTMVMVWDAAGTLLAVNDDADGLDSFLTVTVPTAGDYFVTVTGYPAVPEDPFDSGSGSGAGSEGTYTATIGLDNIDFDVYAVDLRAGDVLSGSVTGAAGTLQVLDPAGRLVFGSSQDASFIFPIESPLAGGGNAVVDHVAATTGRHYFAVTRGTGNYDAKLEVYRPGPQRNAATQTIFLDFDGARVNTAPFGGPGVSQLSPLSAFLGRWGLTAAQENALINRIIAVTTENLRNDLAGQDIAVNILNSRDHADPFGRPNVSRVIIGGTIAESGVDTIGIAQSIDPGNFELEETALLLLDVLSGAPSQFGEATLNTFLTPQSNRVRFVGQAIGNIAAHEAGHYLGNWHVDQFNTVPNIMDAGGNFPVLFGVGPDGIGGTADDIDVDLGEDMLNRSEGFSGIENTRARTRWALARPL
jgi:hypothetical protein